MNEESVNEVELQTSQNMRGELQSQEYEDDQAETDEDIENNEELSYLPVRNGSMFFMDTDTNSSVDSTRNSAPKQYNTTSSQ